MTNDANVSVFDAPTNETVTTQDTGLTQTNSNGAGMYVSKLVGDDKKFKTVDDLAKGKEEADLYIEQLKRENAMLREDKGKSDRFDSFLTKFEEQQKSTNNSASNTNSVMSAEDIANIVRSEITRAELTRTAAQNIGEAEAKVLELYKDKTGEFLDTKSKELGMSKKDLKEISAKSPSAFFTLVGINSTTRSPDIKTTQGSVNTESDFNLDTKAGTKEYYDDLRRKNPKVFHSPKIQNEIFEKVKAGVLAY